MRTTSVLLLAWAARALQAPRRRLTVLKASQSNDEPATRKAVAAVASIGVAETAYLTYSKLTGVQGLCASGCGSVLEGPYAQLPGGVPLAAVGLLAYAAVLFLALGDPEKTRKPLVGLTSAMAAASICLVGLLLLAQPDVRFMFW